MNGNLEASENKRVMDFRTIQEAIENFNFM